MKKQNKNTAGQVQVSFVKIGIFNELSDFIFVIFLKKKMPVLELSDLLDLMRLELKEIIIVLTHTRLIENFLTEAAYVTTSVINFVAHGTLKPLP